MHIATPVAIDDTNAASASIAWLTTCAPKITASTIIPLAAAIDAPLATTLIAINAISFVTLCGFAVVLLAEVFG